MEKLSHIRGNHKYLTVLHYYRMLQFKCYNSVESQSAKCRNKMVINTECYNSNCIFKFCIFQLGFTESPSYI